MEHKDTHHLVVSCDDAGLTLLHYAVTHGNSDVIDLLVSKVHYALCYTINNKTLTQLKFGESACGAG